jgi:hypothetical protein
MPSRGVAGSVYCNRDQAHTKEARGRSDKKDDQRITRESARDTYHHKRREDTGSSPLIGEKGRGT